MQRLKAKSRFSSATKIAPVTQLNVPSLCFLVVASDDCGQSLPQPLPVQRPRATVIVLPIAVLPPCWVHFYIFQLYTQQPGGIWNMDDSCAKSRQSNGDCLRPRRCKTSQTSCLSRFRRFNHRVSPSQRSDSRHKREARRRHKSEPLRLVRQRKVRVKSGRKN